MIADFTELTSGARFGIGAAALQALALAIYVKRVSRGGCRPNLLGWTMWVYGALALFLFQAATGAPGELLLSPAVGGLLVMARAAAREAAPPIEPADWPLLGFNAGIVLWSLLLLGGPAAERGLDQQLGPVFALLSGIGAVTAAWPTLRGTCLEPGREHPVAWFLGSAAYGLGALAVMAAGLSWHYLVYPVLCQAIQLLIGIFALGAGESARAGAAGQSAGAIPEII